MLTEAIQVMQYVRASAGRAGLSVVFEDANHPRHDGKTIYLPKIRISTTHEELQQLMASVDHEVGHERYSDFDVLKEVQPKGLLMFTWNAIEDSRINSIEAREYRGFKENFDVCGAELVDNIYKNISKSDDFMAKFTGAILYWDSISNGHLFPVTQSVVTKYKPNKDFLDVLNPFSPRLLDCRNNLDKNLGTLQTLRLAEDILKAIEDKFPEEVKEFAKEMAEKVAAEGKKGKGKKGKAEEVSESEASSEESLSGEEADGDAKRKSKEDEYKIIKIEITEDAIEKHTVTMLESGDMGKVGINFDPIKNDMESWDLTDFDKFVVIDYPHKLGEKRFFSDENARHFLKEYAKEVEPKLISVESFAQQVRRLIQIRARVQTQYGVKKGKLDQARLSRICFNAPGFNEKIFKNRIENKTLDAAISVLVDMSGSMHGYKVMYALASTLLITEVCTTLGIPLEIVGFSDVFSNIGCDVSPSMYIYKGFRDLKVSPTAIKQSFAYSSAHMNGNPDGENILWAYDRLLKRKERKRLLIVMSDGAPAATKGLRGIGRFTEKTIREIEAAKKVDIYGLGLCSNSVQHYYKANSVIEEADQIPSKLLELLEKKVLT